MKLNVGKDLLQELKMSFFPQALLKCNESFRYVETSDEWDKAKGVSLKLNFRVKIII